MTVSSSSFASSNGTPITGSATTSVVTAQGATLQIRVRRLWASNSSATPVPIAWREDTGGTKRYPTTLPQYGVISLRLESGAWDLALNKPLCLFTGASGSVEWGVDYDVVGP